MQMVPKITVVVMTYNHKDYIGAALDSILFQEIDVDFNILIHDDCSSDGTTDILKDYQKKHPDKIDIIFQSKRQFALLGYNEMIYRYIVPKLKSDYVAICDGDDYWADSKKLQKQFDFMESNRDYSMCFHSAYQLKPNGDMSSKWYIKPEGDLVMSDIINDRSGICAATSSIFIRTTVYSNFPSWRISFPVEDVPLCIDAALHGKIHRFKEIMSVYRQFAVGSWSDQNSKDISRVIEQHHSLIGSMKLFDKEFNYAYHHLVESYINGCEFRIALFQNNYQKVLEKKYKKIFRRLPFKERLSINLQYKHPTLYKLLQGDSGD